MYSSLFYLRERGINPGIPSLFLLVYKGLWSHSGVQKGRKGPHSGVQKGRKESKLVIKREKRVKTGDKTGEKVLKQTFLRGKEP